jgi:hypothetical protein
MIVASSGQYVGSYQHYVLFLFVPVGTVCGLGCNACSVPMERFAN